MKKIRVSAREVVRDIKNRESAQALKDKYSLNDQHLVKLKRVLLEHRLLSHEELDYLALPAIQNVKSVRAKEFITSFRKRPDDDFLMNEYSLNPKDLQKIYVALIEKRLLSEYEYHTRETKAAEVEEGSKLEIDASTEVTLIRMNMDESAVSEVRPRDHQSIPRVPGRSVCPRRERPAIPVTLPGNAVRARGDSEQQRASGFCPNCYRVKTPSSPDSCPHCGIVFSKIQQSGKCKAVSIWDMDYRDR